VYSEEDDDMRIFVGEKAKVLEKQEIDA